MKCPKMVTFATEYLNKFLVMHHKGCADLSLIRSDSYLIVLVRYNITQQLSLQKT